MLNFSTLLDQAKAAEGVRSWYRLARLLGVADQTVTNWRHGVTYPSDELTAKLADLAGVPVGTALAVVHAARQPEGSRLREAWLSLCAALLMAVSLAPAPADAAPRGQANADPMCIMSTRRKRLAVA